MEIKVNALVVKSIDYKDNDKILTLYSLEYGKITAGIKGVKKAGAKLKFASEPFCFAEYILAVKGDRYTVINATYIDNFYNLRLNIKKYYTIAVIADFINNLVEENISDKNLFKITLDAVKDVCYGDDEVCALAKFLTAGIEALGYGIQDCRCGGCQKVIEGRVFFNFRDGEFSCQDCRREGFYEIMPITYQTFCRLYEGGIQIEPSGVQRAIKFLLYYINLKTDVKFVSEEALFSIL